MEQQLLPITIPSDIGENLQRRYHPKYLIAGFLLLGFVTFLGFQIVQATRTTGAYFMTVAELQTEQARLVGQRVRVNGNVVAGSEDWDAQAMTLKFSIQDESGNETIQPVIFYGPRPDNFQRAASAIVEGELQVGGVFMAETLLLKCPSRYEEEPAEVSAKATR